MTPVSMNSSTNPPAQRYGLKGQLLQIVILCFIHVLLTLNTLVTSVAQDRPPTRVIEGRVTNADGKPIKGATVEWGYFLAEKEKREVFRTDAGGKYRVETTDVGPDFRLGASAPGFAPVWQDGVIPPKMDAGKPPNIDFKLPAPISLRGKVVDRDGKPIAGVNVVAQSPSSGSASSFSMPIPSHPFPGPSRESNTNADGEFLIRYLPDTRIIENAADKGFPFDVSIKTDTGTIPRGKAFSKIDNKITVDRSAIEDDEESEGMVRGRVLDEATSRPIENFRVVRRFFPAMHEFNGTRGEFLLDQLKVGRSVQLFVYANDYAPFVAETFADDGGTFVECELKRKPSLKGIVVDPNGQPILGAEVVLGFEEPDRQLRGFYWDAFKSMVDGYMGLNFVQRSTTNEDGRFDFGLVDRHAVVAVMAKGFARQVHIFETKEVKTLHESELKIALEPECVLAGSVKLNGVPVGKASLRLSNIDNWDLDFGVVEADGEGRFSIRELPSGNYHLSVYQYLGTTTAARLTRKILLHKSEQISDLILDNPGGNSSLRGMADPFAFVYLTPKDLDGRVEIEYSGMGTYASPEGDFEIRGLHPGTYTCAVRQSGTGSFMGALLNREIVVKGDTVLKVSEN